MIATVARIAYLSSDIVLSVQPALSVDSIFSRYLKALASKKTPGHVAKEPEVSDVDHDRSTMAENRRCTLCAIM